MRRVPKLIGRGCLPTSLDSPYVNLFYHTLQGIVVVEVNSTGTESLDSSLRIHMAHPPNRAAMHRTSPHMQNFLRGRREILKRTMTFPGLSSQYITGITYLPGRIGKHSFLYSRGGGNADWSRCRAHSGVNLLILSSREPETTLQNTRIRYQKVSV